MIIYQKYSVIHNIAVTSGFWRLRIQAHNLAAEALPGQFVMIKAWEDEKVFLMRPLSINSVDVQKGYVEFLYKTVGKGTELLSQITKDGFVEVLGPLGNGFPIFPENKAIALLGRGVGAAPLRFLGEYTARLGREVYVFLSAAEPAYLFDKEYHQAYGAKVFCSCDSQELISHKLEALLPQHDFSAAYSCGSKRLIRELNRLQHTYGLPGFASIEEHMACGVGACKGCVHTIYDSSGKETMVRVCREGPVFSVESLVK